MLGNIISTAVKTNNKILLGGVKYIPDCDMHVGYIENVGRIISEADFFPKHIKILAQKTENAFAEVERTSKEEQSIWVGLIDKYESHIEEGHTSAENKNPSCFAANDKRFLEAFTKSQVAREKTKALLAKFKKEYSLWSKEAARKMKNCPEKLSVEFKNAVNREDFKEEVKRINSILSNMTNMPAATDVSGVINGTGRVLNQISFEGYTNRWIWVHGENRKKINDTINKALKTI